MEVLYVASYSTEQLRELLKLQGLDSRIDSIQAGLKRARDGVELVALRGELATAEMDLAERDGHLAKLRRELKYQEQEVAAIRAEIASQERKLYGGLVRNPKEATQMQQHVASLRKRMGDLDDHALTLMLEIESLEPDATAARARVAEFKTQLADEEARLEREVLTLSEELPLTGEQRSALAAGLPGALCREYEALRPRRAGTAVVALVDGKCGGCRMTIPYIMVRQIRSGELRTCDTCGRIVVEPE